jgi:hypothetical protein
VFENRVLRRIFGVKRGEETGDWRKPHNEELHNFVLAKQNDKFKEDEMSRVWAILFLHLFFLGPNTFKSISYSTLPTIYEIMCHALTERGFFC